MIKEIAMSSINDPDSIFGLLRDAYGFWFGDGMSPEATSPVAPVAPPIGNRTVNSSNSVSVQNVNIDARGSDSAEIAENINTELKNQLQNTVQDVDSQIYR